MKSSLHFNVLRSYITQYLSYKIAEKTSSNVALYPKHKVTFIILIFLHWMPSYCYVFSFDLYSYIILRTYHWRIWHKFRTHHTYFLIKFAYRIQRKYHRIHGTYKNDMEINANPYFSGPITRRNTVVYVLLCAIKK